MSEHQTASDPESGPERQTFEEALHPRIWVASLAGLPGSSPHGGWLDATDTGDELRRGVERILSSGPEPAAEAWAILDYEEFGSFRVEEGTSLGLVARVAQGIREHGAAFAAWAVIQRSEPDRFDRFDAAYCGRYDSPEAWAEDVVASVDLKSTLDQHVPAWLRPHVAIDYAGIARDWVRRGEIAIKVNPAGGIWVFDVRA